MAKKYQHRVGDAIGGGMLFKEKTQHNTACFVAGTLVHTDKGLVPIQDLKVGDMVLSKPESGEGEAEYKPVLSTFKSPVKEKIYKVEYYNETADDRGEKGLNYLFCTANHPFWVTKNPVMDANKTIKGEWIASEKLPAGYLTSAHGDVLSLDDYSFLPVRTLPNFPEGCAYTQTIEHHDLWNESNGGGIAFVTFNDKEFQLVSLGTDNPDEIKKQGKKLAIYILEPKLQLSERAHVSEQPSLIDKLSIRLKQDIDSLWLSEKVYREHIYSPLIVDGEVIMETKFLKEDEGIHKDRIAYIEKYGDITGVENSKSIHKSMKKYYDNCPNPYEDYVYNIEVAEHHTYFVGHDAVWVHNCDPSNSHTAKFLNHTC